MTEIHLRHSRVLVCGGRRWGVGSLKVNAYDYSLGPQFDRGSSEAQLTLSTLRGLLERHRRRAKRGEKFHIIQGCAPGADSIAWAFADYEAEVSEDVVSLKFPADWQTHGKRAGYLRNQQMLDEGQPNLVVAFSHDPENSKGTKMMVDIARRALVETYVITGPR